MPQCELCGKDDMMVTEINAKVEGLHKRVFACRDCTAKEFNKGEEEQQGAAQGN